MIRADHPSNKKRGGVCIFHKETFGVCVVHLSILVNALFVKYLFKTTEVILVLYIDLQAKILLGFKIFCQILK